jgi:hypothetical protein
MIKEEKNIAEIVKLMPSFSNIYTDSRSLLQYSQSIAMYNPSAQHLIRQLDLADIIEDRLTILFGHNHRIRLPRFSSGRGFISNIVDHQKLISHPAQLSVPIIASLQDVLKGTAEADWIGFSTAAVGLEEPFNRRSIMFRGRRINIYPARRRNDVVFWAPYTDINLVARAHETGVYGNYSAQDRQLLHQIQEQLDGLDFGGAAGLSDQLTIANRFLTTQIFHENIRNQGPSIIQLDFEDIGARYLRYLFENEPNSFPVQMLLDPSLRRHVLRKFDGLVGAWSNSSKAGSHFFWANRNGHRARLVIDSDAFFREDTGERTKIEPEFIVSKIADRSWMPGQILLFSALIFYAGIKPLMGWSREFISRLAVTLAELIGPDYPEEAALIKAISLDNMNLFSILKEDPLNPASRDLFAFDVIANGGLSREYFEEISTVPLKNWLTPTVTDTLNYAIQKYGNM